jgi:methylenetetrahydrofolate dehydrogenase (NADP+) / methenyltetrahydrofolate cyclohydrolase
MEAKIINGKEIARKIKENIKDEIKHKKVKPGLAVVLVGDNPASQVYVNSKEKTCTEIGFYSEKHLLSGESNIGEIINLMNQLNNNPKIHGILLQLPLPNNLDGRLAMDSIHPNKDVDGLHPMNLGNLLIGNPTIIPCTPKGIIKLIESTGQDIEGKNAVVLGRSNLVGKPISILLMQKNATVTICHSKTKNLIDICKNADILVAAIGKPKFVTKDMVKHGAIVIDVGTNKVDGKLIGDVDYEEVKKVAGFITPNPGGVGPMTIACLMENTLELYKKQINQ